jgi:hypothetical protein
MFMAACSAEAPGAPALGDGGGREEDAASAQGGGSGGAGGAGGGAGGSFSDASLSGFLDGSVQDPDAGLDSSAPDAEVDGAVKLDAGMLSPELFAGVWDVEESNCAAPLPVKDTWTFVRYQGPNPDIFVVWNGGNSLRLEGSELVFDYNSSISRRFWLIDSNTLGGSVTVDGVLSCPEYTLTGKRVE